MPFTQTDLAALDTALKSGATEVRFQDRTVRYRSTADMLAIRTLIVSELQPPGSIPALNRQIRMRGDSGL